MSSTFLKKLAFSRIRYPEARSPPIATPRNPGRSPCPAPSIPRRGCRRERLRGRDQRACLESPSEGCTARSCFRSRRPLERAGRGCADRAFAPSGTRAARAEIIARVGAVHAVDRILAKIASLCGVLHRILAKLFEVELIDALRGLEVEIDRSRVLADGQRSGLRQPDVLSTNSNAKSALEPEVSSLR